MVFNKQESEKSFLNLNLILTCCSFDSTNSGTAKMAATKKTNDDFVRMKDGQVLYEDVSNHFLPFLVLGVKPSLEGFLDRASISVSGNELERAQLFRGLGLGGFWARVELFWTQK